MKKNKIVIFAFIILVISTVSIGLNIKNASEQNKIRQYMINHAYAELQRISFDLDGLISNIEHEITGDDTNRQRFISLACSFVRLDTILKQYATYFPPRGVVRNTYASMFNFDFISYTLTAGGGTANSTSYSGILADDAISENEIHYLEALRDDINLIVASMVSPDNPPQENQNLTVAQIDGILNTFFNRWSFHNEESPYFLLRTE